MQHVLEPLAAYLLIAQKQWQNHELQGYYNVGPDDCDCVATGQLVDIFCSSWGDGLTWENKFIGGPHEAGFLKLDCSHIKQTLGWCPKWNIQKAIAYTVEWSKMYMVDAQNTSIIESQISRYFQEL